MDRRLALLLSTLLLAAPAVTARGGEADPPRVTAGWDATQWLPAHAPFEILIEGDVEGRLAVVLGKLDVSALFERTSTGRLRYHGRGPALPPGAHTLTLFRVEPSGEWTAIGSLPVRIVSPRGFVSTTFEPSGDLTGKGRFAARESPAATAAERSQFQDATVQTRFRAELVRPGLTLGAEAQIAGVTFQQEALRFGTIGERAPRVDLAGYRVNLRRGSTTLSAGHLDVGAMRHLVSGFQSRGVALTVGEGRPVSLQLAVLNGTNIVGWDNILGLQTARHRVWSATTGVELRPSRPGFLRAELGVFRGSLEPRTGFNEGGIVTAETSRGGAVRLMSEALGGRMRIDAGLTRSRFDDAFDAEVDGELAVTPVDERTSEARYADVAVDVLQSAQALGTTISASVRLRHEEVAPQFRSLGASVQANLRTDGAEGALAIGPVTSNLSYTRSRDNLGNLESLFTNLTHRSRAAVVLPLASMFGSTQPGWPTLTVEADHVHQFAEELPPSGDFTVFDIPDQKSWNVQTLAEWEIGAWRAGTRLARTAQDDRRLGSETRDFVTSSGALTFDWTPAQRFSLGGELGLDRNRSEEQRQTDSTLRWSARTNWVVYKEIAVAASVSNIRAWDDRDVRDSDNADTSIELSSGFRLSRADRRKGRIFIRWTERRGTTHEREFGFRDARRQSAFATGLTLRMF